MALVSWAAKVVGSERVETVYDTVVGVGRLIESIAVEGGDLPTTEGLGGAHFGRYSVHGHVRLPQ